MVAGDAVWTVEELTVVSSLTDRERGDVKIDDDVSCRHMGDMFKGLSMGDKSPILSSEVRRASTFILLGLMSLF